ncbi:MAG TPA: sigma-70 family RNA polymerase sigma factor [Lacipirellulaceae bacterium]|nr:sigma-70 family RNA polymerase sigma factor [Lacipirellulaceae bacterium]
MADWSQIVNEHGPLVWRTAQRLLQHEADTADCFQRTFIAALELSQRETIRDWPALLRRLATARALEQLRKRMLDRGRFGADGGKSGVDRRADIKAIEPNDAASAHELADHLRLALSQIEPLQAEVFCLACLDDRSYAEIARQLDITSNYVGVLLNRAKAALRERLAAHEPRPAVRNADRRANNG